MRVNQFLIVIALVLSGMLPRAACAALPIVPHVEAVHTRSHHGHAPQQQLPADHQGICVGCAVMRTALVAPLREAALPLNVYRPQVPIVMATSDPAFDPPPPRRHG